MKKQVINLLNKLPYIKGLVSDLEKYKTGHEPGHFYSPIVSIDDLEKRQKFIFDKSREEIPGIELNKVEQLDNLDIFKSFYAEIPFPKQETDNARYYFDNGFYSYSDAIFLYSTIRKNNPKKIIEVGSGYTSALMLDVNEQFYNDSIQLTFIEPYPDRLYSLLRTNDKKKATIIDDFVQDVDISIFQKLEENDILFIDSSHVSKTGSDLNFLLFEVIPQLKKGVLIHFHDVFYPFEYPKEWVMNAEESEYFRGFGWNEDYLLKSFLMYNQNFKIEAFNTYLQLFNREWFAENMPLCLKNEGGSIWIRKTK